MTDFHYSERDDQVFPELFKKKKFYAGEPPENCDICAQALAHENVGTFYDARTLNGRWATLCPYCVTEHTFGRLGAGWGQRYEKQPDGRWLKTGG